MAQSSSDPPPAAASAPVPGLFQRLPRALPVVLFLVGGGVALLAYLALPWLTQICPADSILYLDPTCLISSAVPPPLYPVDYYGPMGSLQRTQPLTAYVTAQIAYFGPAALCLLAALPALVAHRSASWRRASVALGVVGGLYGLISALLMPILVAGSRLFPFGHLTFDHMAMGFYVALAGFALALLGAVLLWRRSA